MTWEQKKIVVVTRVESKGVDSDMSRVHIILSIDKSFIDFYGIVSKLFHVLDW